ncbi:MAG: hypothetical protein JO320_14345 [Alphaproteobacteria bacterium]|nr:hypothetical protein [Alphaproteobacteria bacterium]
MAEQRHKIIPKRVALRRDESVSVLSTPSSLALGSVNTPTEPSTRCRITAPCCLRCSGAMPPQRRITIANVRAAVERYQAFILGGDNIAAISAFEFVEPV